MTRSIPLTLTAAAGALLLLAGAAPGLWGGPGGEARRAPEFPTADPSHWINSQPLSMKELRGRVVILEIWTFG